MLHAAHSLLPRSRAPRGRSAAALPATPTAALLLAALLAACGERASGPDASPAEVEAAAPEAPADLTGVYQVYGTTVDRESGDTRELYGTVVLQQDGERFTSSFELKTEYPVEGGAIAADLIGDGAGQVVEGRLEGQTRTQLVLATVPGVDTGFAFLPRQVGPRIESRTTGEVFEDGTIELVSENAAATQGGQGYRPTRTTLRATRIGDVGADVGAVGAGPIEAD